MHPQGSFLKRFYIYQNERYPFLAYLFLVGSFSFSAIAYSRICRGETSFIELKPFLVCIFNTITLFFLVRVFDEFKDKEDDALYRKYLPVPRGLISLKELRNVGIVIFALQIILDLWLYPKMLLLYAVVMAWLLLMGKEFFVKEWLKKHQFWYVVSHMLIIPLIDVFASGFDWFLADAEAPKGLLLFFAVSFTNGVVLEIGRKIKPFNLEEEGVVSYSKLLGTERSVWFWLMLLLSALGLAFAASYYAGFGANSYWAFSIIFVICSMPAFLFLRKKTKATAKAIEFASVLWTFAMYFTLGGIPMFLEMIGK